MISLLCTLYTLEGESGEHSIRDKGFLSDCTCLLAFKQLKIVWLHAWHLRPWFVSVFPCGHLCPNPPLSESFVASGLQPEGRANFYQTVAPHSLQAIYLTGVNTEGIRPWELPGVGGWGRITPPHFPSHFTNWEAFQRPAWFTFIFPGPTIDPQHILGIE